MSRFTELCEDFTEDRNFYAEYNNQIISATMKLTGMIKTFFGFPDGKLIFSPADSEHDYGKEYYPAGAMHLAQDGYYEIGYILIIETAPNISPKLRLKLVIGIKITNGVINLRRRHSNSTMSLDLSKFDLSNDLVQRFLGEIFTDIKSNTRNAFRNHVNSGAEYYTDHLGELSRKIGFGS